MHDELWLTESLAISEYLAETLLACLGADFYLYLREIREMDSGRLRAGWRELVARMVPAVAEPA